MAKVYRTYAEELNAACVGQKQLILIEGVRVHWMLLIANFPHVWLFVPFFSPQESKRSSKAYFGRNDANTKVIIPANVDIYKSFDSMSQCPDSNSSKQAIKPGDFIVVDITESNSQVLKGTPLYHSTISDFGRRQCHNSKWMFVTQYLTVCFPLIVFWLRLIWVEISK